MGTSKSILKRSAAAPGRAPAKTGSMAYMST
jgi:hypothetical protein